MDKDMVDRVLLARLSLPPEALVGKAVPGPIFYYLLGCWRRVMDIRTGTLRRASVSYPNSNDNKVTLTSL
jgi:hypothetical protein